MGRIIVSWMTSSGTPSSAVPHPPISEAVAAALGRSGYRRATWRRVSSRSCPTCSSRSLRRCCGTTSTQASPLTGPPTIVPLTRAAARSWPWLPDVMVTTSCPAGSATTVSRASASGSRSSHREG
jgi:hypothetical protein